MFAIVFGLLAASKILSCPTNGGHWLRQRNRLETLAMHADRINPQPPFITRSPSGRPINRIETEYAIGRNLNLSEQ